NIQGDYLHISLYKTVLHPLSTGSGKQSKFIKPGFQLHQGFSIPVFGVDFDSIQIRSMEMAPRDTHLEIQTELACDSAEFTRLSAKVEAPPPAQKDSLIDTPALPKLPAL